MSKHDKLKIFDRKWWFFKFWLKKWIFKFLTKNNETLCQNMTIYQILTKMMIFQIMVKRDEFSIFWQKIMKLFVKSWQFIKFWQNDDFLNFDRKWWYLTWFQPNSRRKSCNAYFWQYTLDQVHLFTRCHWRHTCSWSEV